MMDALRTTSPERRDLPSRERLLERVRAEFEELPSLRLTPGQAQRLFGLRPDVCSRVLGSLVSDRSLVCGPDGRFMSREDADWMRARRLWTTDRVRPRAS